MSGRSRGWFRLTRTAPLDGPAGHLRLVPAAQRVEPRFEPSLDVLKPDDAPPSAVQRVSKGLLAPVNEPARLTHLRVAPCFAVALLESQHEQPARASRGIAGSQGPAKVASVEMQKDRVGNNRVERPAETIVAHIQNACLVTRQPEPLNERRRGVAPVYPQPPILEVMRLTSRSAPELKHLTVWQVRREFVQEKRDRGGNAGR